MNPTLTGETGAFKFQGSLVPTSNELYSLGSTTSRWKDLNVSGSVNATSFVGDGSLITGITSGGTSLWSQSSSNVYVTGSNVGINTATPTNALHVVGNTRIEGNLTVNGTQTIVNTNVGTTEQLVITNDGTGPALVINQTGAQPVLDVQDDGVSVLKIIDGGNVGVGTTNPQAKLHVNGIIKNKNPSFAAVLTSRTYANEFVFFNDVRHNEGGHYNSTNGRFTAPVAGTYFFSMHGHRDASNGNAYFQIFVNDNAKIVIYTETTTAGAYNGVSGTALLPLLQNDYVRVFSSSSLFHANNQFAGFLIG